MSKYKKREKYRLRYEEFVYDLAGRNYSVKVFADKAGITSNYLYRLLRGTRNPSPRVRGKILKALGDKYELSDIFEALE